MAAKKVTTCRICKAPFAAAKRNAKTCSPACRKRLERGLKAQAAEKAARLESALGREFHRVAASLLQNHVIHEPFVLADERGGVPVSVLQPPPAVSLLADHPDPVIPEPGMAVEPLATAPQPPPTPAPEAGPGQSGPAATGTVNAVMHLEDKMSTETLEPSSFGREPQPSTPSTRERFMPFHFNKLAFLATGLALLAIIVIGGGSLFLTAKHNTASSKTGAPKPGDFAVSSLPLSDVKANQQLLVGQANQITINGQLQLNDTLVLSPTTEPTSPVTGQVYFDQTAKAPFYYDGTRFVSLAPGQGVSSIGGLSGTVGLGDGLTAINNQISIADSLLQKIAAAGNTPRVNSLQGLTGDLTLNAGPGISINGMTINNGGVLSLSGTTNQVSVSSTTGNITLSLPQDIAVTSTPTFAGLTLGTALTVPNGGTGAGSFTANGILYGNGAGALQVTASAANSVLVTSAGGVPSLSQTLPLQVQDNITHTGVLISGSINNGFGAISTVNNISTTALVQAGTLQVDGGSFTVDNAGNFIAAGTGAVQGAGGLTLGVAGTTTGYLNLANATSTREVILQGMNPSGAGNATVQIPTIAGGTTDAICLVALGNCAGSGGGIIGSGTPGTIAMFQGATNQIADSTLTQSGSTLTASGTVVIQGANALTLGTASGNTGAISFKNSTNANTLTLQAGITGGNLTFTLPTADGTNGQCLKTNGALAWGFTDCTGGAGGGVTSVNGLTGVISLANASGVGSTVTIDNAAADGATKGIATFNATNFSASGGIVNTIQNINNTATPTFGGLTLNGTSTSSALNILQTGSNPTPGTAALIFANNNTVTPSGNLLDLQAQGISKLHVDVSGNLTTIGNIQGVGLTTSGTVTFNNTPVTGGTTVLCLDGSSILKVCSGSAGSTNYILNGTSLQANANFNIQSAAAGSIGGIIRGATSQTADLLQFQNSSGNKITGFDSGGKLSFADGAGGAWDTSLFRSAAGTLSMQANGSSTATLQAAPNSGTDINGNNLNLSGGTGTGAGVGGNLNLQIAPSGSAPNLSWMTSATANQYVAVDSNFIYWTSTSGNIGRANLDGSSPNNSFITGATNPYGIVVNGSFIYWANRTANTIGRANLDGTGANQSFITLSGSALGIAVDSAHIYWTSGSNIGRANLDGTGANMNFITSAGISYGVAVNSSYIYWGVFGSSGGGTTIGRANLDGTGANTNFITGASAPTGLVIDSAHIYWANNKINVNTLGRANLDGSSVNQNFVSVGASLRPFAPAVDSNYLYWTYVSGSNIGRFQLGGTTPGVPVTVASLSGANGAALFQNAVNSVAAFQVQDAAGNNYIQADTNGANLYLGSGGIASNIQIGNTTGAVAQTINIGTNTTASSTNTVVIGSTIGTSPVTIYSGTGGTTFNPAGGSSNVGVLVKPGTDTTAAFQIQNTAGTSNLLIADTTNSRIGLGVVPITTSGSGLLQVGATSSTTAAQGISFGGSTTVNLYRSATGTLRSDGSLQLQGATQTTGALNLATGTTASSGIAFGTDTALYRSAAGTLNMQGSGSSVTLQAAAASGTDISGTNLNLGSGSGTGSGAGGNLNLQISPPTTTNINQSFIATGAASRGVAVNGSFIYWAINTGSKIGRANLDGSSPNTSFITGLGTNLSGVAVDSSFIYWSNLGSNTIGRANLDGSGANNSFITVAGGSQPDGIAVNGSFIYWANRGSNSIGRANLDGTGVNNSFITISGTPEGLTINSSFIYWGTGGTTIGRANLDGTGVNNTFMSSAGSNMRGLAVDSTYIYWGNNGGTTVGRALLGGSSPNNSFITGGDTPYGVAVDSSHVYWVNQSPTNTIGRMTFGITPNTPVTVASLSGVNGAALFQNATDSATAFQIQNQAGTSNLLIADTTNSRIGLGVVPIITSGSGLLQVGAASSTTAAQGISFGGDTAVNLYRSAASTLKTDGALQVAGLLTGQLGATISGAAVSLNDSSNFATNINTGTSTGAVSIGNSLAGAVAIQSASTIALTSGTTLGLTSTGANAINITPGGGSNTGVVVQPTTDSTNAFRINLDDGTRLFTADTINGRITIGNTVVAGNELYVQSNSDTVIRGKNTGSADLLQLANNSSNVLVVNNAGQLQLSTQGNTGGVQLGGDALIYRSNASEISLGSNDSLVIPGGSLTVGGTVASATAFQVQDASANVAMVVSTNNYAGGANAANATLKVAMDSGTSRSINAAGTVNASGTDYAEYIPWSGPEPEPGSIVEYKGSAYVVSSQQTASFVGGDVFSGGDSIMVAFAGQVPTKVTGVVSVGDILVDNGDGTARAVSPAVASIADYFGKIGIAQEASSDAGVKLVHAAVGTTSANVASGLQQSSSFTDLNVSGTATINNLSVTGSATIGTLYVTGSAEFAGDITVGGHIITVGGQPTAQAQAAAGGSASVLVDGTDTTGTITITTGSAPSAGDLAKILFSRTYGAAPHIVLSPSNGPASGLRFYKGTATTTDFMFDASDAPAPNTTYTFDYFIAQ
jgi:hypothetical protein